MKWLKNFIDRGRLPEPEPNILRPPRGQTALEDLQWAYDKGLIYGPVGRSLYELLKRVEALEGKTDNNGIDGDET